MLLNSSICKNNDKCIVSFRPNIINATVWVFFMLMYLLFNDK